MNKNVMNVAVAILFSLGLTACGSKHNETTVSTQPNTTAAEVAAAKKAAETAQANEASAKKEAETAQAEAETARAEASAAKTAQSAAEAKVIAAQAAQAVAERDAQAAKLEATNAALAQAEAEKAVAYAQTQVANAKKALTEAQSALTAAQTANTAEIAKLKAEVAAAQADVETANAAVTAAEAKAAEAESATKAAEAATKAAQAEVDVAKAETKAAQAEAENQKSVAEKAAAEKATAEKALATAQAELSQAEKELTAAKASATKAEEEAATAKADAEKAKADAETAQKAADEANAKLAVIDAQEKADGNRIANSLNSRYFAGNVKSQTYQYLNDETKKAALLTAIENRSGSCDAKYAGTCTRDAKAATAGSINEGDVLFTQNLSYAGYAVVREAYDADNVQSQPVNSYIAVVKTPTTDKAKVVDATYTGTATLTQKNVQTLVGAPVGNDKIATLTLNVKDGVVSGNVSRNTGKSAAYVTFNDTTIKAGDNGVVFEGSATFNSQTNVLTTQKDASGNWIDVNGSYRGAFAGANAEEVVGIFETDSTSKDVSVQGAFSGTKATAE